MASKKHLLNLSEKNVIYFRDKSLSANPDNSMKTEDFSVLKEMQKDFRLADVPFHIECFDNSNFQGDFAVSAMVVFKNARKGHFLPQNADCQLGSDRSDGSSERASRW